MSAWQPMKTAPKDRLIMLLLGETVPDHPHIECGEVISGGDAEKLGYREFAKYGGWLIYDSVDNFYVIDAIEPHAWADIPQPQQRPPDRLPNILPKTAP